MAGRGNPPEGTPDEDSGGDDEHRDDEHRDDGHRDDGHRDLPEHSDQRDHRDQRDDTGSGFRRRDRRDRRDRRERRERRDDDRPVVFDESFVEAARLQEFSARERMEDESHAAVRNRAYRPAPDPAAAGSVAGADGTDGDYTRGPLTASRQGVVLVLLIVFAFATAIYMGVRNPYQPPPRVPAEPMRASVLPLAPRDAVPGATPADLYRHSPAAGFRTGADGVALPPARRTAHFSESQVLGALASAKEYVVSSSLDPSVLLGRTERDVRLMLDPAQHRQFDRSLERPSNDGRHAATGWMVRFDPAKTELADPRVRARGTMAVREVTAEALEVVADHVFVYAVRAAGEKSGKGGADGQDGNDAQDAQDEKDGASLFTVRREVRFRIDREDMRRQQLGVQQVAVRAGPLPCSADSSAVLTPLFAGEDAEDDSAAGTDPYARGRSAASLCGVLSDSSQPTPAAHGQDDG
jgi:hypothetical protein